MNHSKSDKIPLILIKKDLINTPLLSKEKMDSLFDNSHLKNKIIKISIKNENDIKGIKMNKSNVNIFSSNRKNFKGKNGAYKKPKIKGGSKINNTNKKNKIKINDLDGEENMIINEESEGIVNHALYFRTKSNFDIFNNSQFLKTDYFFNANGRKLNIERIEKKRNYIFTGLNDDK